MLHFRLPFSQKSPFGYSVYAIVSGFNSFCLNFCAVPGLCYLIGSCWLFICFTKDAADDLLLLNINGKLKRNRAEAKRRFLNIVRLYTDLKELSLINRIGVHCTECKHSTIICGFTAGLSTNLTAFMSSERLLCLYGQFQVQN